MYLIIFLYFLSECNLSKGYRQYIIYFNKNWKKILKNEAYLRTITMKIRD